VDSFLAARCVGKISIVADPDFEPAEQSKAVDEVRRIGKRIRDLRRAHGYSLRNLARMVNLSPSFLSEIERGYGEPSISALKRIASALDVGLLYFFNEAADGDSEMVTRAGAGKALSSFQGVEFRLLINNPDAHLEPIMGRYEPGAQTGEEPIVHNTVVNAVEWGFILQGRFKVWIGNDVFILNEGDSIYFPSAIPHRLQNIGDQIGNYIWVNAPASF
jgi:transcriptional regulator with XRE-family HTH domain